MDRDEQERIHIKAANYANDLKKQYLQKVKEGVTLPRTKDMEGKIWMAQYEGYRDALQDLMKEAGQPFIAEYKFRTYGYYQDADGNMQMGEVPEEMLTVSAERTAQVIEEVTRTEPQSVAWMDRDTIIRLAREAGFAEGVVETVGLEGFANFAALVLDHEIYQIGQCPITLTGHLKRLLDNVMEVAAQREREDCAQLCDDIWQEDGTAMRCRDAIRSRK